MMAWKLVAVAALGLAGHLLPAAWAEPGSGSAVVAVAVTYSDNLLAPRSILTPSSIYPLRKQNYPVVASLLDQAVTGAMGVGHPNEAWSALASPTERVGILLDAEAPPASLTLVDALVNRLVRAGTRPSNIIIWARSEQALFNAGLLVRKGPEGVSTMGADTEGYLGGLSRIVLSYCDVLINVARLRPDPEIGMWGTVANQLACVPEPERARLLADPRELPSAAARPSVRAKFRLHILDALQPNYEPGPQRMPPYWVEGRVIAGADPVAVDVVGWQLLESKRAAVKDAPWPLKPRPEYLHAAERQYRLGQSSQDRIEVLLHEVGG